MYHFQVRAAFWHGRRLGGICGERDVVCEGKGV